MIPVAAYVSAWVSLNTIQSGIVPSVWKLKASRGKPVKRTAVRFEARPFSKELEVGLLMCAEKLVPVVAQPIVVTSDRTWGQEKVVNDDFIQPRTEVGSFCIVKSTIRGMANIPHTRQDHCKR